MSRRATPEQKRPAQYAQPGSFRRALRTLRPELAAQLDKAGEKVTDTTNDERRDDEGTSR
jgi:hypothetical protein